MEEGGLLDMSINILLSLVLPPAAVFRQNGVDESFWLCVLLTLLVIVPGQLYAIVVTFINRNKRLEQRSEKTIEATPTMIAQPRPQRVVAVTPNYMEDHSEADLRSILMSQCPATPVPKITQERTIDVYEAPTPTMDISSKRTRGPDKILAT